MDPERWRLVSALFDELVELAPDERAARLGALDADLAAELRALLAADASANAMLDADAVALVPEMLGERRAGDAVGPYRLLRLLGEGGMGVVHLAERVDGAYEQRVAVKLLKRGMDSQAVLRRFLQERRILARLAHPHIVRLLDGGMSEDGRPYYVMEYVEGRTILADAAARRLDVRRRVALLAEVAEAVAYAHAQLIVHRDLKPSNVLVDGAGAPRVLDFGIAKLLEDSEDHTMTSTAARILSPAYAAPEQVLGEAIGTATDVYALGLMLCELLTGRLPHRRGAGASRLAQDVEAETIERPSTLVERAGAGALAAVHGEGADAKALARTLRGDLDLVAITALQREPERRYASASALAEDLRRWLDGRPIAARPASTMYRARKFARRHRVGVAASALVALSIVAGFGAALWQAHAARAAAAAARAAERNAQQQAAIATATRDFLIRDVIQAANPYSNKIDIRLTDALTKAGARIDERFAADPRLAGVVRRELADALYLAGEVDTASVEARRALGTLEGAFGAADADALDARISLATILHKQARYDEARALEEAGLAAAGPSVPARIRLGLEVGLAGLDVEDRRDTEALAALDALVPQVEREVGAFEPLHVAALDHRLRSLMTLERYDAALATTRELRAGTEGKFGVGDPRTLEWIKREAIVLTSMKRYDDAMATMRQACDATRAALGDAHYATADCDLRLGIILMETKRYSDAVPLFEKTAAYRERVLGPDSETTWLGWVWLARGYQNTGQHERARALFERSYAAAIRVFGEGDAKTTPFGQTLGMFFEQTGAHADAEKLRRELLEQARRALPAGNIIIAKIAWDLGETLASRKRDEETIAFYAEWMPEWERLFGADDDRVVDARKWLAEAQQRSASSPASARAQP